MQIENKFDRDRNIRQSLTAYVESSSSWEASQGQLAKERQRTNKRDSHPQSTLTDLMSGMEKEVEVAVVVVLSGPGLGVELKS